MCPTKYKMAPVTIPIITAMQPSTTPKSSRVRCTRRRGMRMRELTFRPSMSLGGTHGEHTQTARRPGLQDYALNLHSALWGDKMPPPYIIHRPRGNHVSGVALPPETPLHRATTNGLVPLVPYDISRTVVRRVHALLAWVVSAEAAAATLFDPLSLRLLAALYCANEGAAMTALQLCPRGQPAAASGWPLGQTWRASTAAPSIASRPEASSNGVLCARGRLCGDA